MKLHRPAKVIAVVWGLGVWLGGTGQAAAAVQVKLLGSWLFDQPVVHCLFRDAPGQYPLWLVSFENRLRIFDSRGNSLGELPFERGEGLTYSPNKKWFAIVDTRVNPYQVPPQAVYSYRVYDENGHPAYTYAETFYLLRQREHALLENDGTLLVPNGFHDRLYRIHGDRQVDTIPLPATPDTAGLVIFRGAQGTFYTLTGRIFNVPEPQQRIRLTIYDRFFHPLSRAVIPGVLIEAYPFPDRQAFLVEVDSVYHHRLFLYNGTVRLQEYPATPERIRIASPEYALFLGSGGTQVVSADQGEVVMGFIATAERRILDGIYLQGPRLFVFITGKGYHLTDGRHAWGRLQLKMTDPAGRVVFTSDFESWTPYRPELKPLSPDTFGVIIHNGVFIYKVMAHGVGN